MVKVGSLKEIYNYGEGFFTIQEYVVGHCYNTPRPLAERWPPPFVSENILLHRLLTLNILPWKNLATAEKPTQSFILMRISTNLSAGSATTKNMKIFVKSLVTLKMSCPFRASHFLL
jgi:hypothetical protein